MNGTSHRSQILNSEYLLTLAFFLTANLAIFTFWPTSMLAQERISFIDNDFSAALKLAETEDKLVFIDGYATWCIPCKVMEEEVFVMPEVQTFFNKHFVNVKMDLEKGIGPILSARYQANVLPAYFFVTPDETLIYSFSGQQKIADLMEHARAAQNPVLITQAWDARYAEGDRKPSFLYKYAHAKYPSVDGLHQRLVGEYLATQDDWGTPENVKFIYHFIEVVESPLFDYMVKQRGQFEKVIPPAEVGRTIDLLVQDAVYNRQPPLSISAVGDLLLRSYPQNGEKRFVSYQVRHYQKMDDKENFASTYIKYYESYGDELERDSLLSMADFILSEVDNKSSIEGAFGWTQKIARQSGVAKHLYLAGQLAQKAEDYKMAIKLFKSGLKKAKKGDRDPKLMILCKNALSGAKTAYKHKKKAG